MYKKEEHELLPGQFFSDEPGLYIEGEFGIRLETVLRWLLNAIPKMLYAMSDCLYVCSMRLVVELTHFLQFEYIKKLEVKLAALRACLTSSFAINAINSVF